MNKFDRKIILEEIERIKSIMGIISEEKIKLPIIVSGSYSAKGQEHPADALHSFEKRKSDGFGGGMSTKINEKLKEVYNAGINPDIEDIQIEIDSKNLFVKWSAKIVKNKQSDKAYIGIQTFGSAGLDADRRAKDQKQQMMSRIDNLVDYDLAKDFVNRGGIYIRQYFYKYTTTEYPPHKGGLFGKMSSNLSEEKNENLEIMNTIKNFVSDDIVLKKQKPPYSYESNVEKLQIVLQFLGFSLPKWGVDGKFGPETKKAVEDFQIENKLDETGEVDSETAKKLVSELKDKNFLSKNLSSIQKNKTETLKDDDGTGKNIVIGDSQTPFVANGSSKFDLLGSKGSEDSLWLGGSTLSWLKKAVTKHKGADNIKNIAICTGTNGAFNIKDDVSGLVSEIKSKFPNANLFVIQGSWGWGGVSNVKESKVRKYYKKFEDNGVELIEPPIGNIEPHGNKPIYKTIGANLDSKV